MAKKLNLLVDTDVFIDYFNHRLFRDLFEGGEHQIYYSIVTRKELLSKEGSSDSERREIKKVLKRYRMVGLNSTLLQKYSQLREQHRVAAKEDCLIAATAIVKKFPLVTRNLKHFRVFKDLRLFDGYLRID